MSSIYSPTPKYPLSHCKLLTHPELYMEADMADWDRNPDSLLDSLPDSPTDETEPSPMDIMLDGYIGQTLTPPCTEKYLNIFTSCLEKQRGLLFPHNNHWIVSRPTNPRQQQKKRRATTKPSPNLLEHNPADTVDEIFDRKVDLCTGTIVPQPTVIGVSKKTGVLSPVFFTQRNGTLGIPYQFPFPKTYPLHNATALATKVLKRDNQNMRIRIQWPGYKQLQYEFKIQDKRLDELIPITMARLVERIIRGIHRLFLDCKADPETFQFNKQWKLGDDGIQASEINIIGLIHISRGLWIPILQLSRHIMPRWDWGRRSKPVVWKKEPKEYSKLQLEGSGQSAAESECEE